MYENNKDIGWKKKNNSSSNGGYDDSLIKNQINVLDKKIEDKQDELISGSNVKTINGQSILGSGNITIEGGETGDNITSLTAKNTDDAMTGIKLGCIGDSITAGIGASSGTLYGHLIKDAKDLSSVQMIGYPSEGYVTIYHKLSELNEDCDIIIEFIGVNNRENNYVFNPENFDTNTVEGALNSTMKYLKENFANKGVTVLICTPIQPLPDGNFGAENIWCIADLKIKYAELYGLPVCDLFHDSFFNTMDMSNEDRNTYIPDGIHPNSKGHEKLAECMLKTLNDLAIVPTVQMYKHDKKVFPFVKEEDISDVDGVALATKLQSILARLNALEANSGGGGTPVIPVDSISLEPTNISIDVGMTEKLTAMIYPTNATNNEILWSSSDKNIATVDNGVVLGTGEGTCVITATSGYNPNIKASCTVSVILPSLIDGVVASGLKIWLDANQVTTGDTTWHNRMSNDGVATVSDGNLVKDGEYAKISDTQYLTIPAKDIPTGIKTYEISLTHQVSWHAIFYVLNDVCVQNAGNAYTLLFVKGGNTGYLVPYNEAIALNNKSTTRTFAIIVRPDSTSIYIDGVFEKTIEKDISADLNFTNPFRINGRSTGNDMKALSIKYLRIYDRELSATEIESNYKASK